MATIVISNAAIEQAAKAAETWPMTSRFRDDDGHL